MLKLAAFILAYLICELVLLEVRNEIKKYRGEKMGFP